MPSIRRGDLKDELYRCEQCSRCFMFYSDIDDHFADTGHKSVAVIRLNDKLRR